MHLANSTTAGFKRTAVFILAIFTYTLASAQENSPYSRFGLGNVVPAQNMVNRSMGGISAGSIDSSGFYPYSSQSINLANPASLSGLRSTIFDIGGDITLRTLKSNTSPSKYTSTNTNIAYFQIGFPITPKRMAAKGNAWAVSFGLRPITKVNYKIYQDKRLVGIDSLTTVYEGSGGLNAANISSGIKINNLSLGFNAGYAFGNRSTGTKLVLINDTVNYQSSNSEATSRFTGGFLDLGAQYSIKVAKKHFDKNKSINANNVLRLGVAVSLQQQLKAKRDYIDQTFIYANDGSLSSIDTISYARDEKGTVKLPANYTAGFTYTTDHWVLGADINLTGWSQYSYFNAKDPLQNSTMVHVGGQYFPATTKTLTNKYWSFVKYRAGAYFGNDYVKLNNVNRPVYGITLGAGMPLTSFQSLRYSGDFVMLNAGVDIGQHGNKQNVSIRENITRFNIGVAMSANWFQRRKYN